jgi:hypothetical protein
MTNTIERANAQAMPKATNRRAVLGAVLAAGAAGAAVALPAMTSPAAASPLTPTDQRVLDLWKRRRRLSAIRDRLSDQMDAAEAQLPAWARSGPKYVLAKGELDIPTFPAGQTVGWPEVADVDRQLVGPAGWVVVRPNIEDLYEHFQKASARGKREEATREFMQSLVAHEARVKQQEAERERLGYSQATARLEEAYVVFSDIGKEIWRHMTTSVLAAAGAIMIELDMDDDEEHVVDMTARRSPQSGRHSST